MNDEPEADLDLKSFFTYRMARLQNRLSAQATRILKANSDLSLTEWRIVAITQLHDQLTLSNLASETLLDKGQLSRAVTSLISKGYMRSRPSRVDQRSNDLTLTSAGRAQWSRVMPLMRKRQARLLASVTSEEFELFHTVLDKLDAVAETTDRASG